LEIVERANRVNENGMKILIADDDATTRRLLQSGLMRMGYKIEVAGDGDEAWSVLQRPDAPEIAILDWMMPGMTGVDICRKLRERKDDAYIYVILLTGMDTLNDLVAGMAAGADDYMTKPFKPAELHARLKAGRRILDLQRELLAAQATLSVLASRDALTELWNRRVIMERLDQESVRAQREMSSLGVVLIDIDHFKKINDSLGHPVGDEALRQVAKRLAEAVRPYDSVGRYGGEEFLIVAPNCKLHEAYKLAERIRKSIADAPIMSARGPIAVSASFGVSAMTAEDNPDPKALIEAADRALYRAKAEGRNRVCIAAPQAQASVLTEGHALAADEELSSEGNGKKHGAV
jgi:diguanylate cyclase (GGDEF)-like protein